MPDMFEMMIGAPPSGPDETRATAKQLRRTQDLGILGMLTGNEAISPVGQSLYGQAQTQAKGLQQSRQKGIEEQRLQDFEQNEVDQNAIANKLARDRLNEQIRYNNMRAGIEEKKLQQAGTDFVKMTDSTRKDLTETSTTIREMDRLLGAFQKSPDAFAGSGYPKTGSAANYLASNAPAFASPEMKVKQLWWADWDRIYNLPERNKMFGATLTDNEKAVWAAANINPNMDADQISANMATIQDIYRRKMGTKAQSMLAEGYNPNVISVYLGASDMGTAPQLGASGGQEGEPPVAAAPNPQAGEMVMDWNEM